MSISLGFNKPSFIVDSSLRNNFVGTTPANFTYTLNIQDNHSFNSVAMVSAAIPKTYYTVQADQLNNSFTLEEDGVSTVLTMTEGNYTPEVFIYEMQNLLNAGSVTLGHTYVYTITYPTSITSIKTNKFTYSVTGNAGVQPKFIFGSTGFQSCQLFGFKRNTTNTFVTSSLTSTDVFLFQNTAYITIKSSICRNGGSNEIDNSVLARIPVVEIPDGGLISYSMINLEDSSRVMENTNSNVFEFGLYDDEDNLLNLNGQDWYCNILLYEYNNTDELVKNDLRLKYIGKPKEELLLEEIPTDESGLPSFTQKDVDPGNNIDEAL